MSRLPILLCAAMLMTSTSAFAGDTPDPSGKGEAALPSGSKAVEPPSTPPAGNAPNVTTESDKSAVETSPGEENKGKPKVE
jgi:hypothetical protein